MATPTATAASTTGCEPDPDIAGLGILISFSISASLTRILSTIALWAPKIHTFRYGSLTQSSDHHLATPKPRRLEKLVKSGDTMALSQVVLTIAVITSTLITYRNKLGDPHALLAATFSILALSSALQVFIPNASRMESRPWKLMLLLGFSILVVLVVLVALRNTSLIMLIPVVLLVLGYVLFFVFRRSLGEGIWLTVLHVGITLEAIALTAYLIVRAFQQKGMEWTHGGSGAKCRLDTEEENAWSFGQTVAVIMVVAPVVDCVSSLIEKKTPKSGSRGDDIEM
ncbi:hypothetical protein PRZ48_011501 [Zasmidium cellare]|uniref:Uncharacterized protein n=1 Tax=Zasmidium cellare TaxID=395010 RepID=A0ABR0E6J3_ZASCE|nr:hypothetical protein PRZ48_011501 [Zasmidium cellare]